LTGVSKSTIHNIINHKVSPDAYEKLLKNVMLLYSHEKGG